MRKWGRTRPPKEYALFFCKLTNPPFSVELDNDTKKTLSTGFIFGDKKNSENLLSVYGGKKEKSKLPSVKDLTAQEETDILRRVLKNHLTKRDSNLDHDGLITKYRAEIEDVCKYDRDTTDAFGFVNTWWAFSVVAPQLDYNIFMAEADNIGYKRSKRGEKVMSNELFRVDADGVVQVDDGVDETILDLIRKIEWN